MPARIDPRSVAVGVLLCLSTVLLLWHLAGPGVAVVQAQGGPAVGRYQMSAYSTGAFILDTHTGQVYACYLGASRDPQGPTFGWRSLGVLGSWR